MIRQGIDPVEDRRTKRSLLIAEQTAGISFAAAAEKYINSHAAGWKNGKHTGQWRSTLAAYVLPTLGAMRVCDIETAHVLTVLEPIWTTKPETASRLRGRIETILDWAKVRGYRSGENPARWRGHLDKLLPARSKVRRVEHHPALPYEETAAFVEALRQQEGSGPRALEFAILTACRSGEVRGATWEEVDLDAGIWTIPAARMKAGKEHVVPLSKPAIALLKKQPRIAGVGVVFPGPSGGALSDMAMTTTLRRMGRADITGHGFRSTFRDWAGEVSGHPREVIEHALAHQLKDKAEAAYQRGTLLDKRRRLMDDWGRYCSKRAAPAAVIPIIRKAKSP
jgi:integrase